VGDFAGAYAAAPVKLDATYSTPDHGHAMMEPHASIAAWKGDELYVWTSSQMINWWATDLAKTLGIPPEKVRLMSPFIGGGFGGKLFLRTDALLAALGSRAARRPVKVVLTRPFMFNNTIGPPRFSASVSAARRMAESRQSVTRTGAAISRVAALKAPPDRRACSMPDPTG
jgi:xanthine dehydrogenase YagR molybdenum-binding subunit